MAVRTSKKIAGFVRQFFRLYGVSARMDLAWLLRDTRFALLGIAADVASGAASVAGLFLLSARFGGVGGMSRFEVLFMLGYTTMVTGLYVTLFSGNNGHISRIIGRGQLEHLFLQPLPLPVQLATMGFCPFTGGGNLITGSVMMGWALNRLGISPPWWWFVALLGSLVTTLALILCQSYLFSSAAFYAPAAAEEISSYVIDAQGNLSIYPLSGMPLGVVLPLITVFPTGLMGWFPSLALLGRPPLHLPAVFPAGVALISFFITNFIFQKGLNHYAKTGANRYSSVGHRS